MIKNSQVLLDEEAREALCDHILLIARQEMANRGLMYKAIYSNYDSINFDLDDNDKSSLFAIRRLELIHKHGITREIGLHDWIKGDVLYVRSQIRVGIEISLLTELGEELLRRVRD